MSKLRDRFSGPQGEDMQRFSSSLAVDRQMLEEELRASAAHAAMLGATGLLPQQESERLVEALARMGDELASGTWAPDDSHEDVHMAVEARLVELCGEPGKKLHTARSRNDQVATDVRLWLKRRAAEIREALAALIGTLLDRIERDGRTLIPGYTHLQRGQPVLLGHHLLAHAWPLARDRARFRDALGRLDRSPLGACAMAGTAFPIDRERTAAELGFTGPVENAMDAVSARDHELELAAACAIAMTHLSRMAEELVLWSSSEFRFVRLGDAYTTGSSIMPQKRNPDAAELVRGKAAVVSGQLQSLMALVKALPLSYNRDLQESRRPLFDAIGQTLDSVRITDALWRGLELDRDRFEEELRGDFSLATELADFLVTRGVPFREAHGIVGRLVGWCERHGRRLDSLSHAEASRFHPELGGDLTKLLDPRAAAERRTSRGGTAWAEIERQVALLRAGGEGVTEG